MEDTQAPAGGTVPSFGAKPSAAVPKIETTPESVAARLSASEGAGERITHDTPYKQPEEAAPTAEEPAPAFDLSKLTPEQLINLKAALDNAPLRTLKKGNPIIKLRRYEGRMVLQTGRCINTLHKDELTQITSEVVLIPIRFLGEDGKPEAKMVNVPYKDFMNAEQVKCEVLNKRSEPGRIVEGEVESNERPGVFVELEVTTVKDWFTVKLPADCPVPQIEVEGEIANA